MPIAFGKPEEVLKRVNDLREGCAGYRAAVAVQSALGLSYSNGRQWTNVFTATTGNIIEESLNEEWNPNAEEIRVVDNRIGALGRRIAASSNATRIEAGVSVPRHMRNIASSQQADVSQDVLNGIEEFAGYTRAARSASSLRWRAGSSILFVQLCQKKSKVSPDIALGPDGQPVEVSDKWVRWGHGPLSDLLWEPSNHSTNLEDHTELAHEQVLTVAQFQRIYGPLEDYGLHEDNLPTIAEISPHHLEAASIAGTSLFSEYARNSKSKGLRVLSYMMADPDDPTRWPLYYIIIDLTIGGLSGTLSGQVVNFENPVNPYGHHGRPIFKLDAFRRDDAFLAAGLPHILMGDQDMLNIARSLQLQQLTNVTHGTWLFDTSSGNVDEFVNGLPNAVGGVLKWDSKGNQYSNPPQFQTPNAPNQEYVLLASDLANSMQFKSHVSQANLGIGKTHIPNDSMETLLQEGNKVVDNIIIGDVDTYGDALKLTLGTVRKSFDGPNRMMARLRDLHGFNEDDLMVFQQLDPMQIPFTVEAITASMISRSVDEQVNDINGALQSMIISPNQAAFAMSEQIGRPITDDHRREIEFIRKHAIALMDGQEWPGLPSINFEFFMIVMNRAMFTLNLYRPEDAETMARIQAAIEIQRQINNEQMAQAQGAEAAPPQNGGSTAPQQTSLLPSSSGSPESINPLTNPVGAAGGLPLGLG